MCTLRALQNMFTVRILQNVYLTCPSEHVYLMCPSEHMYLTCSSSRQMALELSGIVYHQNTSNEDSTMGIDAVAALVNVLVLGMRIA